MSWVLEIRLGPNTHIMIIGGIEVKIDSRSTCIPLMADIIKLSNCGLIRTEKASGKSQDQSNTNRTGDTETDDPPATIPAV